MPKWRSAQWNGGGFGENLAGLRYLCKTQPKHTKSNQKTRTESGGVQTAIARSENELSVVPLLPFIGFLGTVGRQEGGDDRDRRIDADQRPRSELATAQHPAIGFKTKQRRKMNFGSGGGSDRRLQSTVATAPTTRWMGAEEASQPSDRPRLPPAIGRARCLLSAHPTRSRSGRVRWMALADASRSTAATVVGAGFNGPDLTMNTTRVYT